MRELFRPAMLICLVLLVPIVPLFFLSEEQMETTIQFFAGENSSRSTVGAVVFSFLALDIFLPVPSSAVNTLAGGRLGIFWGTIICWTGMNIGAIVGFWMARRWGRTIALLFSKQEELDRMQQIIDRFGQVTLIIVRGIPVLAEASVLLTGMHQLEWRKFLAPVLIANFVLAFLYSALGKLADDLNWFAMSLAVAIVFPVLFLIFFKWLFEVKNDGNDTSARSSEQTKNRSEEN